MGIRIIGNRIVDEEELAMEAYADNHLENQHTLNAFFGALFGGWVCYFTPEETALSLVHGSDSATGGYFGIWLIALFVGYFLGWLTRWGGTKWTIMKVLFCFGSALYFGKMFIDTVT